MRKICLITISDSIEKLHISNFGVWNQIIKRQLEPNQKRQEKGKFRGHLVKKMFFLHF